MSQRWMFVAVSLTAFVASACQVLLPDDDPDEGGAIYNDTDETVFIYADMAGGGEIRLVGANPATTVAVPDPCLHAALYAKHSDDWPVVDTWEGGLCRGDYWSIPKGGLVENRTSRTIGVQAVEPGTGTSYAIRIEAGGTGSLCAPCADPPITADGDRFEAPPRQESVCLGDMWVIEEP